MSEASFVSSEWSNWLDEYANKFLLYARQKIRNISDAEDLLQDALIESWKRMGYKVPPPALVYATIRRRAIDRARQTDSRSRRELVDLEIEDFFELPSVDERARREVLVAAINKLPEDQQEVVFLRIWGGLAFKEISATIHAPLPTVASRYKYAIGRLKQILKETY